MNTFKSLLTLGFIFLANGITFLIVGLTTHLKTLWMISPSFIVLGTVFLAISKSRKSAQGSSPSP